MRVSFYRCPGVGVAIGICHGKNVPGKFLEQLAFIVVLWWQQLSKITKLNVEIQLHGHTDSHSWWKHFQSDWKPKRKRSWVRNDQENQLIFFLGIPHWLNAKMQREQSTLARVSPHPPISQVFCHPDPQPKRHQGCSQRMVATIIIFWRISGFDPGKQAQWHKSRITGSKWLGLFSQKCASKSLSFHFCPTAWPRSNEENFYLQKFQVASLKGFAYCFNLAGITASFTQKVQPIHNLTTVRKKRWRWNLGTKRD